MTNIWLALLAAWIISAILELAAGRYQNKASALAAQILSMISAGILFGLELNLLAFLFLAIAIYRAINLMRILAARLEPHNLRRVSARASAVLLLGQLATLALAYFWPTSFASRDWLELFAASQLLVAAVFVASFLNQLAKSKFSASDQHLAGRDLPTLTVAIPAKNETSDLEQCLESLLANDYPKLEVLVLDDSAGSKTGQIINALAHDGVRFILGQEPDERWLAKNLAYDRLASEANGELVLFCGVDVRFGPNSLRSLVENLIASNNEMISVMPLNRRNYKSLIIQPMRYFWELARPRLGTSSPVLSTCWLIRKNALDEVGGFKAVASEIVPERYFAGNASVSGRYAFYRSSGLLGVASAKSPFEQRATAIRTRYPLLHKRLASAAGISLFSLAWLIGPLALVIILPFYGWSLAGEVLAAASVLVWLTMYGAIIRAQFGASVWLAPSFYLAALADIYLVNLSLIKYEFGQVIWKGRDAARQVMGLDSSR